MAAAAILKLSLTAVVLVSPETLCSESYKIWLGTKYNNVRYVPKTVIGLG